jgi:hypothetical protein
MPLQCFLQFIIIIYARPACLNFAVFRSKCLLNRVRDQRLVLEMGLSTRDGLRRATQKP